VEIQETKIPDVIPEIIDESKQILANNIIKNVYPLFNELYSEKIKELNKLKYILDNKKNNIKEEKENLQNIMLSYKKKKKITKLLERIEKLITSGLLYDGVLKHEITILIKVIDKLSEKKLDYHLNSVLNIISKRFSN
jgi:50S ribosomal subunit-associated GTPase HflX